MFQRLTCVILVITFQLSYAGIKEESYPLNIKLTISENRQNSFKKDGRLFVFLSTQNNREPRTLTWPTDVNTMFAKNFNNLNSEGQTILNPEDSWTSTANWSLDQLPNGTYYLQVLWDQNRDESRIDAPGNMYSKVQKIEINGPLVVELQLSEIIGPRSIIDNKFVKEITFKSDTLSKWWGKEMILKASVIFPKDYFENPDKKFPVRYNIAGYGGRYTRINRIIQNENFSNWWFSDSAPQVINVFLDGEGPFGDSYQMDSDNSGPYGYSLIHELIPFIETSFRGTGQAKYRFVDGCSTGGWVSLALQLYYPDEFNGVFSYSPDAVEFEHYQLINIYKDKNALSDDNGEPRPVSRNTSGEPTMLLKDFIQYENVLGWSDTYVTSGGQFSAHTALYSPKGDDGLPAPLFDPESGVIDPKIAEYWKKYDMKLYARDHWEELGPKIQGKIYIWMGDMDNFYLNLATHVLDEFLKTTKNPASDAEIVFTPNAGHCANFSDKVVLEQIGEKLKTIH